MFRYLKTNNAPWSFVINAVIFVVLLLLPIIVNKNLYLVGGDDTRLYYIFPWEFLRNFAFNIISDNALGGANLGYNTAAHFIPIVLFISFLKKIIPFINVQSLMYGFNYAFAYIFFYLFLSFWIKNKNNFILLAKVVSSLFYVLSPFLSSIFYKNQSITIYLVFLIPAIYYFFTRAVIEKKYVFSVAAILLFSMFSTTLNSAPWSLPILLTGFPYLIYIFLKNKKSFVINTLIVLFFGIILNFYWIFHFINSNINNQGVAGSSEYYSTQEFIEANMNGLRILTRIMDPLVPVLTRIDYAFKQNFTPVYLINIVFLASIIFAGIFIKRIKNRKYSGIYIVSLGGLLTSWFLFSPNLGNWGPDYFINLILKIPFGLMFRNMFDKFAPQLAFYYSFSLAISLVIIGNSIKSRSFPYILLAILLLTNLSNSKFFIERNEVINNTFGSVTGEFNKDFINMVGYLKDLDNASRVLWIPMTAPNYVIVEDEFYKEHFYSGLTPLRVLANRGDYAGRFSFMIPKDLSYGDKILELLKERNYEEFGKAMQKMNAEFIVVDKQVLPERMKDYLFDADRKYLRYQDQDYKNAILGEKLKDFGERYSFYYINEKYRSDRLFLTDDLNVFPKTYSDLKYKKISSYEYQIEINDLKTLKGLVFLDSYNKEWVLNLTNGKIKTPYLKGENVLVYDWANGWMLDPEYIKNNFGREYYSQTDDGGLNVVLSLYFEPQKYTNIVFTTSILGYIFSGLLIFKYAVTNYIKKLKNHA